ncbi:Hint domain-containing protein [Asaia siamensis]
MTNYKNASGVTYGLTYRSGLFGIGATYDLLITYANGGTDTVTGIPASNVLTTSNTTLSIVSILGLGGGVYVIPPGFSGTVTTVLSALSGATIHVGGTAIISTGASALSSTTIDVDGGNATLASGLVANALSGTTVNINSGGVFSNGSGLLSLLSGSTINFGQGGGTFIANAGGALVNLSSTTITGFNAARDIIQFTNLSSTPAAYQISTSGNSQTITVTDGSGNTIASMSVTGVNFTAGTYSTSGRGPLTINKTGTTLSIEALASVCFLAGSMIRTPEGDKPVETLESGDSVVVNANGEQEIRKIIWVGSRNKKVNPDYSDDESGYPVRIRKHSLGSGNPYQDLLVTSEHCIFIEGKFIPARMLVNGINIVYDRTITEYRYYHLETAEHSVIYANGAETESYLDTGNRIAFTSASASGATPLRGSLDWSRSAAPLCVDREFVEAVFMACKQRSAMMMPACHDEEPITTADRNIRLVTEDQSILLPRRVLPDKVVFFLPPDIRTLKLQSNMSRPCDVIGPFVDDRRSLGVLVGKITLFEADKTSEVHTHLKDNQSTGWHSLERQDMRWTDGNALLVIPERRPESFAIISIEVLAGGPYLLEQSEKDVRYLNRDTPAEAATGT